MRDGAAVEKLIELDDPDPVLILAKDHIVGNAIYIQGHRNGEWAGIPLRLILGAFDKQESDHKDGFYRLSYDTENICDLTVTIKNEVVTVICVHRPCSHLRLFESILDVLRAGPYVLFSSDGSVPIVANPNVVDHLPDGMIEALGEPLVVNCADDIRTALET